MLVDAIIGKTPVISCCISGEDTNMVLDMGSEVTILQEWWFNEHLMTSVNGLKDASVTAGSSQCSRVPLYRVLHSRYKCVGHGR